MSRGYIALIATLFFVSGGTVFAQQVDPVQFVITPEVPGPNQAVRIEVQGVGGFLGEANITWTRDSRVEGGGVGERVFTFTTGALGESTSVRANINSSSHGSISRTFVFVPSLLNLVWEADTYTPALYRGKALYTAGSPLKVVALPTVVINGTQVANASLTFQWRRNGEVVPSASGLGRSTFSFIGDQLQPAEVIEVDAYIGTSLVARGGITVPTASPIVVLYNRDPLRGVVYEQAFPQAIALTGREITVQAEPYYFSNQNKNNGALSYSWTLNGQETTGPDAMQGILTLRQEGGSTGSAALSVSVQNNDINRFIQQGAAAVQIYFGQGSAEQSSPFGAAAVTFNRLAQSFTEIQQGNQFYSNQTVGNPSGQSVNTTNFVTPGASTQAGPLTYTPLEPLHPFAEGGYASISDYLSTIFHLLLIGGALFAVLMLTIAGVRYMTSELGVPQMQKARERIKASVFGLLLLAASWLILNTINPELLKFKLNIPGVTVSGGRAPNIDPLSTQALTPRAMGYFEGNAVREALGCGLWNPACFARSDYIVYDPKKINDPAVKQSISDYTKSCSGASNLGLGTVRTVNGSIFGANGGTALVCSMYSANEGGFLAPEAGQSGGGGEISPYAAP